MGLWEIMFSSLAGSIILNILLNKIAGAFLVGVGIYSLHGNVMGRKTPHHLLVRLFKEKYAHESAINMNIILSIFTIVLGVWVLLS